MPSNAAIVKDLIRDRADALTPSERQLSQTLLRDYPTAGLQSITKLAAEAAVSTPTVIRMARKLGFDGFPDLQAALRAELSAQVAEPMKRRDAWRANASEAHALNQFAEAVSANIRLTLERLDMTAFDGAARLLADTARPLSIVGGRITRSNADYLFNHMQIIRPNVSHLSHSANVWPQYLLDMDGRTVLVLFDIRRYESDVLKLAELAKQRGAAIVLFTDQWGSPIASIADHAFNAQVEAPSSWDSTVAIMLILEALIAQVQTACLEESKGRIEDLEAMFSATKLFRDFT